MLMREFRLLVAETLLGWALDIMPKGPEQAYLADSLIKYFRKALPRAA